jgi:hypothetical protein
MNLEKSAKVLSFTIMKRAYLITSILFFTVTNTLFSQEQKIRSWQLKGNLDDMQIVQFSKIEDTWTLDNQINNRVDFTWNPGTVFRTASYSDSRSQPIPLTKDLSLPTMARST